jgi:hypothetical protein
MPRGASASSWTVLRSLRLHAREPGDLEDACRRRTAGLREKAKTLLHHMTVDLLRESFCALKRKAAPGVDGVTWYEYETGLEEGSPPHKSD